ncbi:MAG: hypothetical protein ACYC3L_16235 [Gemmatimonadaceae bacterium]
MARRPFGLTIVTPLKTGVGDTPGFKAGISKHPMSHFQVGNELSGEAPARMYRSGTVAWTVSVALHMLVFTLAADRPWFVPLEFGARVPSADLPVQERIAYLSIAAPEVPTILRTLRTDRAARRLLTGEHPTASDHRAPNDGVEGGLSAPVTTSPNASAPIVNAPARTRVWLSPSRWADAAVPGDAMPLSELRIGLRAAIAAAIDSINRDKEKARAASDWTLKIGRGSRLGVSPMRVHLGLFEVPVPVKVVSLRDFEPLSRTRRLMLDEVYEQRDRALRDSIITESIAAVRARSKERARLPQ